MPFARTSFPGLTTFGHVEAGGVIVDLSSKKNWEAFVDHSILFPMESDDLFLHVGYHTPMDRSATNNKFLVDK